MTRQEQALRATIDGEVFDLRVAGAGDVSVSPAATGDAVLVRVRETGRASPLTLGLSGPASANPGESPAAAGSEPAETRARVAIDEDVVWVSIGGDVFRFEMGDAEHDVRRRDRTGHDALAAPMPATVTRILVEPGQEVARGDTLVLLEAMKMEMPIRAPRDARVAAVRCQAGELVQPGVPLVDLEDAPAG